MIVASIFMIPILMLGLKQKLMEQDPQLSAEKADWIASISLALGYFMVLISGYG